MKAILMILCLVPFINVASADSNDFSYYDDSCTVELQTAARTVKERYYSAYGCYTPQNDCKRELRRRQRQGKNPYASCVVISGRNERPSCTFDLKLGNGRIKNSFTRRKCREARRLCKDALWARQSRGKNPYAYCEKSWN